ncbi:MAG: hypothetical protein LBJ00_18475 [Planctomycetaceae bacterium]|jgi:hypothetical protein|nr:hypothetical protein [Planctomycetaceae bacterium]
MRELVICCILGYVVGLFFELSRFFFRGGTRVFFVVFGVLLGFAAHSIFLYYHHISTQNHSNGAETYFFMTSWSLVLVYFYLSCCHRKIPFGLLLLPIVLLLIIGGIVTSHIAPIQPADNTTTHNPPVLKMFHAITFFLATSSICIGFVAGLLYLVQDWRLRHKKTIGILRLPTIEWSESICRKNLSASTFIIAATMFFGLLLQPQSNLPNSTILQDPLVIGVVLMFISLVLFSGILPLKIFKSEGKRVAVITLITFIFLITTLLFGILSKNAHWKRITPKENPTIESLHSSCFKIPEAAVNLQRKAFGKRNNVKQLFKSEAYRPTGTVYEALGFGEK